MWARSWVPVVVLGGGMVGCSGGENAPAVRQTAASLIGAPPQPTKSYAMVLVDTGGGLDITAAQANTDVFGVGANDASVRQFMIENSYGRQDITGDVVGPFNYSIGACNAEAMATALRPQVDAARGSPSHHYLWYFSQTDDCAWSGNALYGTPANPARDTWFNGSTGCVVLNQEPLHNLGMQHSSALDCGTVPFAADLSTCTHSEYGDRFDVMGGGCRHLNVWQKAHREWLGGCNSVRVNSNGIFTLLPLEIPCNGIQALQIPMPVTNRIIARSGGGTQSSNDNVRFYYLELRTRVGFDSSMTQAPTVLVHVGPEYSTSEPRHTWLLDMVPSTSGPDGMAAAASFTDPAGGVSFTVLSLSAASATVSVSVPTTGANTCIGGGTLVPPGPTTCGGAGGTGGVGGSGGSAGTGGKGGAGASGTGGSGGSAGASGGKGGAGAGGTGGAGGSGGSAGASGGKGGAGGTMAGAGGGAGAAASGGVSFGGAGATGGTADAGRGSATGGVDPGAAGEGGIGGSDEPDAGPRAGRGGRRGTGTPEEEEDDDAYESPAGCGCRVDPKPGTFDSLIALGALGAVALRWRRRRRLQPR